MPAWTPYDCDQRTTMVFDTESRVVNDYQAEVRKLMET